MISCLLVGLLVGEKGKHGTRAGELNYWEYMWTEAVPVSYFLP